MMKKLAILLAVAMLFGVFALTACTPAPANSSEEPAPASSEEPAPAASSEEPAPVESSEEPTPVESSEEPAPDESPDEPGETSAADPSTVKTSKDVSNADGDNLALGATVKGVAVNPANPAYSADLTDGKASQTITYDNNWFGLYYQAEKDGNTKDGEAKFTLDLGEVKSINLIRANFFLGAVSGILAPESVKFEVSEDGKKFVSLGKQNVEEGAEGNSTCGWIGYALEENINAQFIRMTVKVRGVWTFLNEIEVY